MRKNRRERQIIMRIPPGHHARAAAFCDSRICNSNCVVPSGPRPTYHEAPPARAASVRSSERKPRNTDGHCPSWSASWTRFGRNSRRTPLWRAICERWRAGMVAVVEKTGGLQLLERVAGSLLSRLVPGQDIAFGVREITNIAGALDDAGQVAAPSAGSLRPAASAR